jgi:parvulin-like peptidyl-prolyl isomerase
MNDYMINNILVISLFTLLMGYPHAVSGAVVIDRIVAVVDREVVTESELDSRLFLETKGLSGPKGSAPQILRSIIENKMITQTAQRMGVRVTADELEQAVDEIVQRNKFPNREAFREAVLASSLTWEQYRSNLKAEITFVKLVGRAIEPDLFVSDEQVQDYYGRNPERFSQPDQIELEEILFPVSDTPSPEALEEVRGKAAAMQIAIQNGELPPSMEEGERKRLGVFKKGDLAAGLEQIVFNLDMGEVSPPVQTPEGFHLFMVTRKMAGAPLPFEKVQRAIMSLLVQEKKEMLTRQWLSQLQKQTFIEIK